MLISRRVFAVALCVPALTIHGQQRQVSGPVAGYLFDGAALRPIAGVPGGATLGDAISLGVTPGAAIVSPQLDSAIVTASDGSLHLFRMSGSSATEVTWNGAPHGAERVVYSPSGTAAAIYAAGRIQVVQGLPNSPQLSFAADAAAPAPERAPESGGTRPAAMAVSDDGQWLLVAGQGSVRLLDASGSTSVLFDVGRAVAVAFAAGAHRAAVLNGAGPTLEVFPDVTSAPSQRMPVPGFTEPVGIAFSPDGKLLVAAARSGEAVTVFDVTGGTTAALPCDCVPTGVARMGNMFRLTDAASGPVWMVDMSASQPRIVFVPARGNQ